MITVQRFRKKPIVIEAIQFTGQNWDEVKAFTGEDRFGTISAGQAVDLSAEVYDVLHSTWVGVKNGQWIIRGVQGEFYPIDETVLAETYDMLGDSE